MILILQGDSMLHLAVSRSNSLRTQNIFEEGGSQMVNSHIIVPLRTQNIFEEGGSQMVNTKQYCTVRHFNCSWRMIMVGPLHLTENLTTCSCNPLLDRTFKKIITNPDPNLDLTLSTD
jgi:hypothetical protein